MVVTNTHIQGKLRNPYEDAKKVVEAVLVKRQDPRNPIKPDRVYVSIASCYNGDRPKLDRQILKIAEMYGVNGLTLVDFLNQAYKEFEAERKALGDTRQYANDEQATLEALEKVSGGKLESRIIGEGKLGESFVGAAEARLEEIFGRF